MRDVLLLTDRLFLEHRPELLAPSHPERAERLVRLHAALDPPPPGVRPLRPARDATRDELARVHTTAHIDAVLARRGEAAELADETYLSPGSVDVAVRAAGTALALVDALLDGAADAGMALVRPPGHHAPADRAMGFCVFNNVAVAAAHALDRGLGRVLVVDWDVHLGNGTQAIFRARRDVLVIDLHQDELYPPGGAAGDMGEGEGEGYTVNLPLPPGAGDDHVARALEAALAVHADRFRPELVLVSAGFDAHARDPEGGLAMSAAGFGRLTRAVRAVADRWAGGRLGLVLEGGYDVEVLGPSAHACLDALVTDAALQQDPPSPSDAALQQDRSSSSNAALRQTTPAPTPEPYR